MRSRPALSAVVLLCVLSPGVLPAQTDSNDPPREDRIEVGWRYHVPVTLVMGGSYVTLNLLRSSLAPRSCKWCDRNADGSDSLNGVDKAVRDALRWSDTGTAATASNVLGYGIMPITAFGLDALVAQREGRFVESWGNSLIILQALFIADGINVATKYVAGRERPFVHVLPLDDPARSSDRDNNASFFSGHATSAFALAVASGTVASMRGYRGARWVWITGLTLATATSYLRIAADKHYLTDVLTGVAVGSGVGYAVPHWLHRKRLGGPDVTFVPQRDGGELSLTWRW
jgi:membrane-associated phospholipid phosphatase